MLLFCPTTYPRVARLPSFTSSRTCHKRLNAEGHVRIQLSSTEPYITEKCQCKTISLFLLHCFLYWKMLFCVCVCEREREKDTHTNTHTRSCPSQTLECDFIWK